MTNDSELAQWPFALQAPFRFYGKDGTKFQKNCATVWFDFIACDSFEVQKGSQLFIRAHNETLSIAAMCVS